jgi:hypothetical protein
VNYFHSRYISRHFVVDVIWRFPARNVTNKCYLASCTLQFWSNLTKIIFQGKHFNHFIVVGGWRNVFWSDTHHTICISLRYTRNTVRSQIAFIGYVSSWKSSYDVDNEMARNIARVKVIHSYLYNNLLLIYI